MPVLLLTSPFWVYCPYMQATYWVFDAQHWGSGVLVGVLPAAFRAKAALALSSLGFSESLL